MTIQNQLRQSKLGGPHQRNISSASKSLARPTPGGAFGQTFKRTVNLESLGSDGLNKDFEQKLTTFNDRFLESLTDSLTQQLGLGTVAQQDSKLSDGEDEEMDASDQPFTDADNLPADTINSGRSDDNEVAELEDEVIKELETKDQALEEQKT